MLCLQYRPSTQQAEAQVNRSTSSRKAGAGSGMSDKNPGLPPLFAHAGTTKLYTTQTCALSARAGAKPGPVAVQNRVQAMPFGVHGKLPP